MHPKYQLYNILHNNSYPRVVSNMQQRPPPPPYPAYSTSQLEPASHGCNEHVGSEDLIHQENKDLANEVFRLLMLKFQKSGFSNEATRLGHSTYVASNEVCNKRFNFIIFVNNLQECFFAFTV